MMGPRDPKDRGRAGNIGRRNEKRIKELANALTEEEGTEDVTVTAFPDPENPKCSDFFYRCGNGILSKSPKFVKDQLSNSAPPQISDVEGGVERTCLLLALFQMAITAVYLCENSKQNKKFLLLSHTFLSSSRFIYQWIQELSCSALYLSSGRRSLQAYPRFNIQ